MPNRIFTKLVEEKIEIFKRAFSNAKEIFYDANTGKLIHPGEFGVYREKAVIDFLKSFIPNKFQIDSGFVLNNNDEVSHQCDLIIFDSILTPNINSSNNQRFFPIETVVAAGEVKSVINSIDELKKALMKLSNIKIMRERIVEPFVNQQVVMGYKKEFHPDINPYDQLCTFLICEKFGFDIKDKFPSPEDAIFYLYNELGVSRYKHNFILSIEDGLFLYLDDIGVVGYPVFSRELPATFITSKDDYHFIEFILSMLTVIDFVTILSPDLKHYINRK
ncbi:DUF6602 domain-containing protein [Flavobacterium sp.]|uniref:DUF6602 domain-containing protein n=1 Tax=Flavobacterium sp. TaxID=239 RepID=UPI0025C108CF|nr:DUF6602 domain-containing protein [Flavobacterium sp.]